jgi:hypothetical protein
MGLRADGSRPRDAIGVPGWPLDLCQRLDAGLEVVDLDGKVAEAGADGHRAVGEPMHEFEGNELIAGELEHGQAGPAAEVNPTDWAVPESV